MKYGLLNTKNPDYNELETRKLQILYKGGQEVAENAHLFIHQDTSRGENQAIYFARLQCVSYRNYMAKIINDYVSDLFSKSLVVVPASDADDESTPGTNIDYNTIAPKFYRQFAEDTDFKKHNLSYVLSNLVSEALVAGRAYIGVDFPKTTIIPTDLKQEEDLEADRAYTYCVPVLSVIDWDKDEFDRFRYVVLKTESTPRKSVMQSRDRRIIQFKIWEREDSGLVKWTTYEIEAKLNKDPRENDDCKKIAEGIVSFKDIPIIELCMPDHLWIGGLIGNMAKEHLQRMSELVWAQKRSLFSIPVYKQGNEIGAGERPAMSVVGQNENRGESTSKSMKVKGFAVIGPEDEISFAEPEGKAYQIVDTQLKELVDAIHAVVNQMGTTVTAMSRDLGRSGLSKMIDNRSKELVLTSYANIVKDLATTLYTLISEGRNEDIIWRTIGMENFKIVDRQQLIEEATQMATILIPSKAWKKHYYTNIALATAGDVNAATQQTIKDEIDIAIDKMSDEELLAPAPANDKKVMDKDGDGE